MVKPAKTEGPYFVDEMLNRSDIRIEPSDGSMVEGVPLQLVFQVTQVNGDTCEALEGAQVDVWHCDALGNYSDVNAQGVDNTGKKFLRGYQVTDKLGTAAFITIYPGWYRGRTVHIHFKIRTDPASDSGYEFTSQLFFDEAMTDVIYAQKPYSTHSGRDMLNADDGIFADDGETLTLDIVENEDDKTLAVIRPSSTSRSIFQRLRSKPVAMAVVDRTVAPAVRLRVAQSERDPPTTPGA